MEFPADITLIPSTNYLVRTLLPQVLSPPWNGLTFPVPSCVTSSSTHTSTFSVHFVIMKKQPPTRKVKQQTTLTPLPTSSRPRTRRRAKNVSPTSTETDPIEDLPVSVVEEETQHIQKPTGNVCSGSKRTRTRKESVSLPPPESSKDSDFVPDDDVVGSDDHDEDYRNNLTGMSALMDEVPEDDDARLAYRSVPETPEPEVIDAEEIQSLPSEKEQSDSVRKRNLDQERGHDSPQGTKRRCTGSGKTTSGLSSGTGVAIGHQNVPLLALQAKVEGIVTTTASIVDSVRTLTELVNTKYDMLKQSMDALTNCTGTVKEEKKPVRDAKLVGRRRKTVKSENTTGQATEVGPIEAYQERMFSLTPNFGTVFCDKATHVSIARGIFVTIIREVNKDKFKTLTPEGFMSAIEVFTTAPKRGKTDKVLQDKMDDFFRRLVRTCLEIARENSLHMFSDGYPVPAEGDTKNPGTKQVDTAQGEEGKSDNSKETDVEESDNIDEEVKKDPACEDTTSVRKQVAADEVIVVDDDPRDQRPWWVLFGGDSGEEVPLIGQKEILEAQLFDKGITKKSTYDRRVEIGCRTTEPTAPDFTLFAAKEGFALFTKLLNDNRKSISKSFFTDIGYLFNDWEFPKKEYGIDKGTLLCSFPKPFSSASVAPVGDVEKANVYTVNDMEANLPNVAAFEKLRESRPDLCMVVQHDVLINTGKSDAKRLHTGRKKSLLTRGVHLMDVAVRLVSSCSGISLKSKKEHDIFAANKYSIFIIYSIAVILRRALTNQVILKTDEVTVRVEGHVNDDFDELEPGYLTLLLRLFQPGQSEMGPIFKSNIGAVPHELYEKQNIKGKAAAELRKDQEVGGSAKLPGNEDSLGE